MQENAYKRPARSNAGRQALRVDGMEIIAAILHDDYTDENGKKVPYTDKVIGVRNNGKYKVVSNPDFMTFEMSKADFMKKTTDRQKLFEGEA